MEFFLLKNREIIVLVRSLSWVPVKTLGSHGKYLVLGLKALEIGFHLLYL